MDYKENELTLNGVFKTAWNLAKKHWLWLILLQIVAGMCNQIGGSIGQPNPLEVLDKTLEGDTEGVLALKQAAEEAPLTAAGGVGLIIGLLTYFFVLLVTNRYLLKAVNGETCIDITELVKSSLGRYGKFAAKYTVYFIALFAATLCCVLPGVYLLVRLCFVPLIAVNEPELSISETFSRSMTLTRGRFWQLLGYGIVAMLVVFVGLLAFCVGALYAGAVTSLMLAYIYVVLNNEYLGISETTTAED